MLVTEIANCSSQYKWGGHFSHTENISIEKIIIIIIQHCKPERLL